MIVCEIITYATITWEHVNHLHYRYIYIFKLLLLNSQIEPPESTSRNTVSAFLSSFPKKLSKFRGCIYTWNKLFRTINGLIKLERTPHRHPDLLRQHRYIPLAHLELHSLRTLNLLIQNYRWPDQVLQDYRRRLLPIALGKNDDTMKYIIKLNELNLYDIKHKHAPSIVYRSRTHSWGFAA